VSSRVKPFVIELGDRALSLARSGQLLASDPSCMFNGTPQTPGANAWSALRTHPTAISTNHLDGVVRNGGPDRFSSLLAAEITGCTAEHPVFDDERVWIAAPAHADAAGLGTFLGISRQLSMPVDGFIDAAVVSVAALGLQQDTIVLEVGLHHVAATAVAVNGGQARRRRAVASHKGGVLELYESWLELVATAMVKRTRFDPLHDATIEQKLFDDLPLLAREADVKGSVTAAVSKRNERFEVELTRDQFARAGATLYREAIGLLHQLRPAGAPVAIVMPREAVEFPGMRAELEKFVGCDLIAIPNGFAAVALSLLEVPDRGTSDPRYLIRRLPLCSEDFLSTASRERLGEQRLTGPSPSHILLNGRAYSLNGPAVVVGRGPMPDTGIILPDGLAGVSRRHCTFVREQSDLVLLDHSTFGTFVNAERVAERVRVYSGDRVRLGEPGIELALIAVGDVRS
jgi:hypothetical protein